MTTHTNGQPAPCGSPYGDSAVACTRLWDRTLNGHADSVPGLDDEHHAPTGDGDGFWCWA